MSFAENDGSREPSETIDEFCAVEHLSRSSYYKMRKLGYGPDEMVVPGIFNYPHYAAGASRVAHQA